MIRHEFYAMGTHWAILCEQCDPNTLTAAENLVRDYEARLSRFRPDSALSTLNSKRRVTDPIVARVLHEALVFRETTHGRFDPTLGLQLASLGYDRDFATLASESSSGTTHPSFELDIRIQDETITLEGPGLIDLGGIAKGWTVDRVLEFLTTNNAYEILVDGGGDIRVLGGQWSISVGDDFFVTLKSRAIATSSTCKRRWTSGQGQALHHILDPRTGLPANTTVDTVTVIATDAMTADAWATATLVDPAAQLPLFFKGDTQAAVRALNGSWYTTPNWSETP